MSQSSPDAAVLVAPSQADDEGPDRPTLAARLKAVVLAPVRLFAAAFMPDKVLRQEVLAGRWGAAFFVILLFGTFGALSVGSRLDVSSDVLARANGGAPMGAAAGGGGGGNAATHPDTAAAMSDREIQEQIAKDEAMARVMLVLKADGGQALGLLISVVVWFLVLSFVGGKPTRGGVTSAVMHASLPTAVQALVTGVAALSQRSLTPAQAQDLIDNPIAHWAHGLGPVGRLFEGVSPFTLWSVLLLGLGLAAAASMTRRRAMITTVVCFALFLGLSNVVCTRPPEGGGDGHGQHGPHGRGQGST
jgi:hypothetical protein